MFSVSETFRALEYFVDAKADQFRGVLLLTEIWYDEDPISLSFRVNWYMSKDHSSMQV